MKIVISYGLSNTKVTNLLQKIQSNAHLRFYFSGQKRVFMNAALKRVRVENKEKKTKQRNDAYTLLTPLASHTLSVSLSPPSCHSLILLRAFYGVHIVEVVAE